VTYTVTTERSRSEVEKFTNFFTNRKQTAAIRGTSNTDEQHAPQQSVSGAKLQKVAEYDKVETEKIFYAASPPHTFTMTAVTSAITRHRAKCAHLFAGIDIINLMIFFILPYVFNGYYYNSAI